MTRSARAVSFLGTATGAIAATGFVGLTGTIWAGMYLPAKTAILVGAAGAFVPGFLLNKMLTRSYQKLESGASEWGSIFGTLLGLNLLAIPVLCLGLVGVAPQVASQEAFTKATVTLGLLEAPDEASLKTFPASEVDTGVVWVHNVGTEARPRVISRTADGALKAVVLPPRGKVLSMRSEAFVGPHDTETNRVMLCPIPEDGGRQVVENHWDGGVARFVMDGGRREASFTDAR